MMNRPPRSRRAPRSRAAICGLTCSAGRRSRLAPSPTSARSRCARPHRPLGRGRRRGPGAADRRQGARGSAGGAPEHRPGAARDGAAARRCPRLKTSGGLQRVATLEDRSLQPAPEPTPVATVPAGKKAPSPRRRSSGRSRGGGESAAGRQPHRNGQRRDAGCCCRGGARGRGWRGRARRVRAGRGETAARGAPDRQRAFGRRAPPHVEPALREPSGPAEEHGDALRGERERGYARLRPRRRSHQVAGGSAQVCKDLQSRGVACRVAAFAGESL